MSDQREALEQLQRRVAQLENLVRRLLAERGIGVDVRTSIAESVPPASPSPFVHEPPHAAPLPPRVHPTRAARAPQGPQASTPTGGDWEQWVGQRGLLIVGVLALLATGGFFLNYAFDHGWIPEWARAAGAALIGLVVAAWGDRLVRRGLRVYGAALIGAGGGLVYLGIWAAAGRYNLLAREPAVLTLGLVAAAVAFAAVRHRVEGLAVWALIGAYLAPAFLPGDDSAVERLLVYLVVVGASSMAVGRRLGWRTTFDVALGGLVVLPVLFAPEAIESRTGTAYFALIGIVGLVGSHRTGWPEARLAALIAPWLVLLLLLLTRTASEQERWIALVGGLAMTISVWVQHRRLNPLAGTKSGNALADPAEAGIYLAAPLAPVYLAAHARPELLGDYGGMVALALGVLYVGGGWRTRTAHSVGMGMALLALAVSGQWEGLAVAVGWTVLASAGIWADRTADQRACRDVGVGIAAAAFVQLFSAGLAQRPGSEAAFAGPWAAAWYALLAGVTAGAAGWRKHRDSALEEGRTVLVLIGAGALLLGGSLELQRLMREQIDDPRRADLAGQVVTSTFWLFLAASTVTLARHWSDAARSLRTILLSGALGLVALSFVVLFVVTLQARPATDPAFTGVWSLGFYAQVVLPLLAARWWKDDVDPHRAIPWGPAFLWLAGGVALLLGGSIELHRFFRGDLAGDLAISTFWVLYAGALVRMGFWLGQKAVRSAGLAVAGLAVVKIAFYDLSELEALYRVASFFGLAVIALALAYAYHRRARA